MFLKEWLELKVPMSKQNPLAISVVTDGLNPTKDRLLGITIKDLIGTRTETVLIRGGDCKKTSEYTGLDNTVYERDSVGVERALELIGPRIKEAPFLVGYSIRKFGAPFLAQLPLSKFPVMLDLLTINKCRMTNRHHPTEEVNSLEELEEAYQRVCATIGGSLGSVDKMYLSYGGGALTDLPPYLQKTSMICYVWNQLMMEG